MKRIISLLNILVITLFLVACGASSFTVSFNTGLGSSIDPVTVENNGLLGKPADPIHPESDYGFEGWYKEKAFTNEWDFDNDKVTSDITLYAKYDLLFDIAFNSNGGSQIDSIKVLDDKLIPKPSDPTRENYVFEGWFTNALLETEWNFLEDRVDQNITLYAKWKLDNDNLTEYTVSFSTFGGTSIPSYDVVENSLINPPSDPEKTGYDFKGWYKDSEFKNKWDFDIDKVTEDITLYAQFVLRTYEVEVERLVTTEKLVKEESPGVVQDAPDLLIIGAVLDTFEYFFSGAMSSYEYIKVYNNTESPYNMINHRVVLGNPIQGVNLEDSDAKVGNKTLVASHLYMSMIKDDFIIPAKSIGLIWMMPYNFEIGCGTNAATKTFSTKNLVQADAFAQTIDDFKEFWGMEDSNVPIYRAENMGIVGKRIDGGTTDFFPIFTPGGGTAYTHLNSTLLRSIQIDKFNNQGGTASISVLNDYDNMTEAERENPTPIYGKDCYNVVEVKDNNEVVDAYLHTNVWKYFDPVIRINICGLVDPTSLVEGEKANFAATSNAGIYGWQNTIELQFRPPLVGERIMQWQLPAYEKENFANYMDTTQYSVMRIADKNETTYRFATKTVLVTVNPNDPSVEINWRSDEVKSDGRMSNAAPSLIHVINLTRP